MTQRPEPAVTAKIALALVTCGVVGGSMFILIKELVGQVSPLQLVAARVALSTLVLAPIMVILRRTPPLTVPVIRGAAILSVIDAIVPYGLVALAAPHVLASTAALLTSTMPLFTGLFVAVTDKVRLPVRAVIGVSLGAAGVAALAGPSAMDFGSSAMAAILAVLLSAACYAAAAVYARGLLREADPIGLSAIKFAIASVLIVPVVALREGLEAYSSLTPMGWLALLAIGCVATGLARCGYVWVIATAGSVAASLLTYIVPVAALALSWLFLDETISWSKGIGAALVCAAVTSALFGSTAWKHAVRLSPSPGVELEETLNVP